MFEKDNTPLWLGGLVAVAAIALVASYSQIRAVNETGIAAAGQTATGEPRLTREQLRELTNIAPAAGQPAPAER